MITVRAYRPTILVGTLARKITILRNLREKIMSQCIRIKKQRTTRKPDTREIIDTRTPSGRTLPY